MLKFKLLLKWFFLGVSKLLPRQSFDKLVYLYASRARSKGKMGFYCERLVNFMNREIVIDKLKKKGIYYKLVEGRQIDLFEYILETKVVQPFSYLEFGVYRGESIN